MRTVATMISKEDALDMVQSRTIDLSKGVVINPPTEDTQKWASKTSYVKYDVEEKSFNFSIGANGRVGFSIVESPLGWLILYRG